MIDMIDTEDREEFADIPKRVQKGVDWLNERDSYFGNKPWYDLIDLDTFQIVSPCNCVLGQLAHHLVPNAKDYCDVVIYHPDHKSLGNTIDDDEAWSYGFEAWNHTSREGDFDYAEAECSVLQNVWFEVISKLKGLT